MDLEVIIPVIIWIGIVFAAILDGKKKKKAQQRQTPVALPSQNAKGHPNMPNAQILPIIQSLNNQSKSFSQETNQLPVEGERITQDNKSPIFKTNKSTITESKSILSTSMRDKEYLRKLIVLGEVLEPKF